MRIRSFAKVTGSGLLLLLLMLSLVRCHRAEPTAPWPMQESGVSQEAANGLLERLDRITSSREAFSLSVTDEELTSLSQVYLCRLRHQRTPCPHYGARVICQGHGMVIRPLHRALPSGCRGKRRRPQSQYHACSRERP